MESERPSGNGARKRRLGAILALLTAMTCLFILEAGVRIDDQRRSSLPQGAPQELALLQENPMGTGSYRLRPNLDLETRVGNTEIRIRTNSHGMHWRETPIKGEPGRQRVAFLGDSFTFGSWATDSAHTFVGVFESRLPAGMFEALNFGVGGYGLLDEELILQELALQFDPSYVVVVAYMGNDFRDTWLGLNRERLVNGTAVLNDDTLRARVPTEQLVEDTRVPLECPAPAWRRVARSSAAFRRLAPLLDLEDLCVRFRPNRNFFMPGFWSTVPPPGVAVKARESVIAALSRMDLLARSHGARLALVALPTSDQAYALEATGRGFDTSQPQAALQTFCGESRIPFLDLLPLLRKQAAASNRRLYLKNDIHLNDFGHARVGEFIADWFLSRVRREGPEPR